MKKVILSLVTITVALVSTVTASAFDLPKLPRSVTDSPQFRQRLKQFVAKNSWQIGPLGWMAIDELLQSEKPKRQPDPVLTWHHETPKITRPADLDPIATTTRPIPQPRPRTRQTSDNVVKDARQLYTLADVEKASVHQVVVVDRDNLRFWLQFACRVQIHGFKFVPEKTGKPVSDHSVIKKGTKGWAYFPELFAPKATPTPTPTPLPDPAGDYFQVHHYQEPPMLAKSRLECDPIRRHRLASQVFERQEFLRLRADQQVHYKKEDRLHYQPTTREQLALMADPVYGLAYSGTFWAGSTKLHNYLLKLDFDWEIPREGIKVSLFGGGNGHQVNPGQVMEKGTVLVLTLESEYPAKPITATTSKTKPAPNFFQRYWRYLIFTTGLITLMLWLVWQKKLANLKPVRARRRMTTTRVTRVRRRLQTI